MTLYTFDKDTKGAAMSACTGKCIAAWPPFVAAAGAMAEGDWTIVDVIDKDGMAEEDVGLRRHAALLLGQGHQAPATPPAMASAASGTSSRQAM